MEALDSTEVRVSFRSSRTEETMMLRFLDNLLQTIRVIVETRIHKWTPAMAKLEFCHPTLTVPWMSLSTGG